MSQGLSRACSGKSTDALAGASTAAATLAALLGVSLETRDGQAGSGIAASPAAPGAGVLGCGVPCTATTLGSGSPLRGTRTGAAGAVVTLASLVGSRGAGP